MGALAVAASLALAMPTAAVAFPASSPMSVAATAGGHNWVTPAAWYPRRGWRYGRYGHYGWGPGPLFAGAALGIIGLGLANAYAYPYGYPYACDPYSYNYYGSCGSYYGYGYDYGYPSGYSYSYGYPNGYGYRHGFYGYRHVVGPRFGGFDHRYVGGGFGHRFVGGVGHGSPVWVHGRH